MRNLIEYPHIAAEYLHLRFTSFLEKFLKKDRRLKLAHHWFRYEWQFRGSGHIHGFLWFHNAPDISTLDINVEEDRERLRIFFDESIVRGRVFCKGLPPSDISPITHALPFDMSDEGMEKDLSELANRVQRHTCSSYCLRPKKRRPQHEIRPEHSEQLGPPEMVCRFGFPLPIATERSIERDDSRGRYTFLLKRDAEDVRINQHCPHMLQVWRANTDLKPVLSLHGVLSYMAKYASKSEKASPCLLDTLRSISLRLDDEVPAIDLLRKMLLTYPVERDISSQEACHQLLGLPMVITSFKVVYANLHTSVRVSILTELFDEDEDDAVAHTDTTLEKYTVRQPELDNISMHELLERYQYKRAKAIDGSDSCSWSLLGGRANARVVIPIPDVPGNMGRQEVCRVAVLLHVPFRSLDEFNEHIIGEDGMLEIDQDGNFVVNWRRILEREWNRIPEWKQRLLLIGVNGDPDQDDNSNNGDDLSDEEPEIHVDLALGRRMADEGWERVAGMGLRARFDEHDISDVTTMGQRQQDLDHDWCRDIDIYGGLESLSTLDGGRWISVQRADALASLEDILEYVDPSTLNIGQRKVFNTINNHHLDLNTHKDPLRIIISGTAGTGKSYMIQAIRYALCYAEDGIQRRTPSEYCPVAAFTGVAAFNVNGVTLHSLFHLGLNTGNEKALSPDQIQALRDKLKHMKYLFLDEKSMLGGTLVKRIHDRLAAVFPEETSKGLPFGGRSVILIGDFAQLPPVGDIPMYVLPNRVTKVDTVLGFNLYRQFTLFIRLSTNMRQQGVDQDQFRGILLRARDGDWTEDDREILFNQRAWHTLSPQQRAAFDRASRLLPTNKAVREHNCSALEALGRPVAVLKAVNLSSGNYSPDVLAQVDPDTACNLTQTLHLSVGSRVVVKKNLWTSKGLVNGALGYLRGIVWLTNERGKLPDFVLVEMDHYSGPPFLQQHPRTVPIAPYQGNFEYKGASCIRIQVPLVLSWAITIHKSQGMTLDKAVIDIGRKEMANGLTFVAVSRVRRIGDIAFSTTYNMQRLTSIKHGTRIAERLQEELRLDSIMMA